jgi:hypothetical protein
MQLHHGKCERRPIRKDQFSEMTVCQKSILSHPPLFSLRYNMTPKAAELNGLAAGQDGLQTKQKTGSTLSTKIWTIPGKFD